MNLNNIKKDDFVIIQLTHFVRFDFPFKDGTIWKRDGWQLNSDIKYNTNEYMQYFNTISNFNEYFSNLAVNRIFKIINYIYENITKNVYVFSWDIPSKELLENTELFNFINFISINDKISVQEGIISVISNSTIKGETNGIIDDTHLGEIGNRILSEILLNKLK